jgi:hypothetical protein
MIVSHGLTREGGSVAIVTKTNPLPDTKEVAEVTDRDRRPAHEEPSAARVMDEASAIYPDTFDTAPTPDEIAAEAYGMYLARGSEDGHDQDDWLEAERRLKDRRSSSHE